MCIFTCVLCFRFFIFVFLSCIMWIYLYLYLSIVFPVVKREIGGGLSWNGICIITIFAFVFLTCILWICLYLYFLVFVVKRELGGGRFRLKWQELLDLTSLRNPCNDDDDDDEDDWKNFPVIKSSLRLPMSRFLKNSTPEDKMSIKASSHLMEHIGGQAVVLMLSTTTKTHTFSQTNNSPLPFFFCYNAMFRLLLLISDQGYTSLPKTKLKVVK